MSGEGMLPRLRAGAGRLALIGGGASGLLAAWALLASPAAPAAGWLVGLCLWVSVSLGAVALLAIHAVTGGRWGDALRPVLAPAAGALPAFLPLLVPLLLALPVLYPWAGDPGRAAQPEVARLYLNPTGFALRSLVGLALLSAVAVLLLTLRGGARGLAGALGLVLLLAAATLVATDWLLSLDPRFRSTAIGAAALVMQVLLGLAWAALLRPEAPGAGPEGAGDLAALLMTAAIGWLYLGFVQFLVAWYGDLPDKAAWFLAREGTGWLALQGASLLLSSILPIAALLPARARGSPAALAWIGGGAIAGVLAHLAWIVAPASGAGALAACPLGAAAVGGLWLAVAYGPLAARLLPGGRAARAA